MLGKAKSQPLHFDASLDRYHLNAGQPESDLNCLISIEPDKALSSTKHKDTTISICLVFDCSVSMMGANFKAAIETAKMIVDLLDQKYWISLVAFQSYSQIVFQNEVPSSEEAKEVIKKQMDQLKAHLGGTTDMAAGIDKGMTVLADGIADTAIMVLLSDGTPDNALKAQVSADAASEQGIQLYAVGMGLSYQADQLLRLVTPSSGAVFGDSEVEKIKDIFKGIIQRVERIFATNVQLQLRFDSAVQLQGVYKISPERASYGQDMMDDDNLAIIRVGNIEENKSYQFLLQMAVEARDAKQLELMHIQLSYDVNRLDLFGQSETRVLNISFDTKAATTREKLDDALSDAIRSAAMIEMSEQLLKACAAADTRAALEAVEKLQQQCEQEDNETLKQHVERLKSQLENQGRVTDHDLNDFLLASTAPPPKRQLIRQDSVGHENLDSRVKKAATHYDTFKVLMIDPGEETIRLMRVIREETRENLQQIAQMVKYRYSIIASFDSEDAAQQLQTKLEHYGATTKIHKQTVRR